MKLAIIAAVAMNGVIGHEGKLPWILKQDLEHFKKATLYCDVIMGRGTYESIASSVNPLTEENFLEKRYKILVSKSSVNAPRGIDALYSSLDAACSACAIKDLDVYAYVIGGGRIYEEALANQKIEKLVITVVDADVSGDVTFPLPGSAFLGDEVEIAGNLYHRTRRSRWYQDEGKVLTSDMTYETRDIKYQMVEFVLAQ